MCRGQVKNFHINKQKSTRTITITTTQYVCSNKIMFLQMTTAYQPPRHVVRRQELIHKPTRLSIARGIATEIPSANRQWFGSFFSDPLWIRNKVLFVVLTVPIGTQITQETNPVVDANGKQWDIRAWTMCGESLPPEADGASLPMIDEDKKFVVVSMPVTNIHMQRVK